MLICFHLVCELFPLLLVVFGYNACKGKNYDVEDNLWIVSVTDSSSTVLISPRTRYCLHSEKASTKQKSHSTNEWTSRASLPLKPSKKKAAAASAMAAWLAGLFSFKFLGTGVLPAYGNSI
jgi:hypothetical protein